MSDLLLAAVGVGIGLVFLVAGGEFLVRGASALAAIFRIPPLVIGLTVVAFGTSAPELAVSVQAAYAGSGDLAVGNLVGSNIANVLLILGLAALVAPITVSSKLVQFDVPLVIGASLLLLLFGLDGAIQVWEGISLLGLLGVYNFWSIRQGRAESETLQENFGDTAQAAGRKPRTILVNITLLVLGLVLLGLGAHWLVEGAVAIARFMGVQELIIGLTVVAIGTSMPELVTTIVASVRGQRDLAVGNVLGSNLFNILGVLGVASIVAPDGIPVSEAALALDIPIMIATAVACLPIFFTGHRIARWEGGLFFLYYLAYMTYLVLDATAHSGSAGFALVMTGFVLPLTVITLIVCLLRASHAGATSSD
jgi:cation:H+ antiporter